ncbi:hypothetical protein HYX13_05545 [Candidatus Woesearchaeota archaeon]|nr:hypothetical protein [Candidatus Woesearchaeota archaeon]
MTQIHHYQKTFTRDFTLVALEVYYACEAKNVKQWSGKFQKHLPYIVFRRTEGTVRVFYDPHGIQWIKEQLKEHLQKEGFLKDFEKELTRKMVSIKTAYETEKTLQKEQLLYFLNNFEDAYTWIEAMWWLCHMYEDGEIKEAEVESILKLREKTDMISSGTDNVVRNSLMQLFPQIKNYIHVLTLEEVKTEKMPSLEELKKRDAGFFYTDGKLFSSEKKEEIEKKYSLRIPENEISTAVSEVRGSMAYPGKIKGKVRKVMGHKEIPLVQKGEILVSPMTMPDFITAMEKAAAFVTDEGGILCHAAIVARELKIPCIVGTEIATKVFKDGDFVEVDAEKGVVRKIDA